MKWIPASAFILHPLFCFLMAGVFAAATAELLKFQTFGRGFLILGRSVVPALAISALEHNIIPRHKVPLKNSVLSSLFLVLGLVFDLWSLIFCSLYFVLCSLFARV